jgi:ankyrin repeat protein
VLFVLSACGRGGEPCATDQPYAFEQAIQRGDLKRAERLLLLNYEQSGAARVLPLLHWAVLSGNGEFAARLAARGAADINERDSDGFTPLMWAAGDGQLVALQVLIQAGADLNLQSESGNTALHYAIASPRPIARLLVRMLVEADADPYITNARGEDAYAFANAPVRARAEMAGIILSAREAKNGK